MSILTTKRVEKHFTEGRETVPVLRGIDFSVERGEIVSLDARLSRINDFSMLVEFDSGMAATFVTSADASWYFPYERVEVFGEYSTIETAEMESISYRLGLESETVNEDFRSLPPEQKLGLAEVPVHVATGLTPTQLKAYRIADNQTATIADWNFDLLPIELASLEEADFDLGLLGFSSEELTKIMGTSTTGLEACQ